MNVTQQKFIEGWAQELIVKYFKRIETSITLPIPVFDIAEKFLLLNCDVEELHGKLANVSALLIPSKRWVLLNKWQGERRLRYSLAHEIAHWLVDTSSDTNFDGNNVGITYINSIKATIREQGAQYFASSLLMPRALLKTYATECQLNCNEDVQRLADVFNVSTQAMSIRLEQICTHYPELTKIEQSIVANHTRQLSMIPSIPISKPKKYRIVSPPSKVIDHWFVRQLKTNKEPAYILLSKESRRLDVFLDIKPGEGFLFLEENDKLHRNSLAQMEEVDYIDSSHRNMYYQKLEEQAGRKIRGKTDLVYTRDPDDEVPDKLLQAKSISKFVKPRELYNRKDARGFIRKCQKEGKKVVIVTGCFDLIADAHVRFLRHAKKMGDVLVVGIESDQRIREFKGPLKPINTVSQRKEVLEAIRSVDYTFVIYGSPRQDVVQFYTRLHKQLKADVLAISKGDPHTQDRKFEIESAGGKLEIISVNDSSDGATTNMLRRLLEQTISADIVFVKKKNIYQFDQETETPWRQLSLPFLGE